MGLILIEKKTLFGNGGDTPLVGLVDDTAAVLQGGELQAPDTGQWAEIDTRGADHLIIQYTGILDDIGGITHAIAGSSTAIVAVGMPSMPTLSGFSAPTPVDDLPTAYVKTAAEKYQGFGLYAAGSVSGTTGGIGTVLAVADLPVLNYGLFPDSVIAPLMKVGWWIEVGTRPTATVGDTLTTADWPLNISRLQKVWLALIIKHDFDVLDTLETTQLLFEVNALLYADRSGYDAHQIAAMQEGVRP